MGSRRYSRRPDRGGTRPDCRRRGRAHATCRAIAVDVLRHRLTRWLEGSAQRRILFCLGLAALCLASWLLVIAEGPSSSRQGPILIWAAPLGFVAFLWLAWSCYRAGARLSIPPGGSGTIYVALRDEAVDVWRPVDARRVGDRYRIVSKTPPQEDWEFPPGSLVRCELRKLAEGWSLVAVDADDPVSPGDRSK
jgi:hypothetical protein